MGSFLDLVERLIGEPAEKVAYLSDPRHYLRAHGFGAFDRQDVERALRHAAHAFPPVLAAHVSPLDGLAHLAEVHLHDLSLHAVDDFRTPFDHGWPGQHEHLTGSDHGVGSHLGASLEHRVVPQHDHHVDPQYDHHLDPRLDQHVDAHVGLASQGHATGAVPTHAELSRDVGLDRAHASAHHLPSPGDALFAHDHAPDHGRALDHGHAPDEVIDHQHALGHEHGIDPLHGSDQLHGLGAIDHPWHEAAVEHAWDHHSWDAGHVAGDHDLPSHDAGHDAPGHDGLAHGPFDDHHVDGDVHHG
jgi:hypothetical protein